MILVSPVISWLRGLRDRRQGRILRDAGFTAEELDALAPQDRRRLFSWWRRPPKGLGFFFAFCGSLLGRSEIGRSRWRPEDPDRWESLRHWSGLGVTALATVTAAVVTLIATLRAR